MQTHVRYFAPGHYLGLIKGQNALTKWNNIDYLKEKIGSNQVYGVHYLNKPPFHLYAHDMVFTNQRGEYQTFNKFMEEYYVKFGDKNIRHKGSVKNIIYRQPLPQELADDLVEPEALNKAFNLEHITYNILSQDFQNLATFNSEDQLHCVVSGIGETISLVSPYQRLGVKAGQPVTIKNPETKKDEELNIPNHYTFIELVNQRVDPDHVKFLKVNNVELQPGDCVYIPMQWWFQISTHTVGRGKPKDKEESAKWLEDREKLSVSVDFWYGKHSYFVDSVFKGVDNK